MFSIIILFFYHTEASKTGDIILDLKLRKTPDSESLEEEVNIFARKIKIIGTLDFSHNLNRK